MSLRWERCSGGRVPKDAVHGGWEASRGEALFVGRGVHNGNKNPGKVHPSHNVCYIAFGDKEFACNDYEVLVNPGNRVHLEWEHYENGNVPPNAVEGGSNPEGEPYYIGRHSHRGDTLVGKIHTRKGQLYVSYAGSSVTKRQYAVLVRK